MAKRIRRFFQAMLMVGIAISVGNIANAQCPQGKTTVIWINGILGQGPEEWSQSVDRYETAFFKVHPGMEDSGCVQFIPVYNKSAWAWDFVQSIDQLVRLARNRINLWDPSMQDLLRTIKDNIDDKVILVGHSQGSLYTNLAYQYIRDGSGTDLTSSNINKIQIINIGTPDNLVADNNGRYTTACGDAILLWLPSLPANIKTGSSACLAQLPSINTHSLDTYMKPGSNTQKQIFADLDLALRLQDSGCGGVVGCQLKDTFSDGNYVTNFMTNPYDSGSVKEESGALWLKAQRFLASAPHGGGMYVAGKVTARTRRVFSGVFNASFRWNFIPTGNPTVEISFVRTSDNASAFELSLNQNGWNTLEFKRTETQVTVLRNGSEIDNFSSRSSDEYYLKFNLESDKGSSIPSTLLIDDLLVAAPIPALTATCTADPAVITAGQSATFTGSSTGGTGIRRGTWSGVVSGSGTTATYRTSPSTEAGFGNATYTVTDSSNPKQVAVANCQVEIKAPVQKGTVVINTNGTVPSVSCKLNGTSVTGPGVFNGQSVGSKILSCTPPSGFTLTSITPSETQTLVANGEITFTVNLAATSQAPTLNSISVNTEPRVNTRISVTLSGSGLTPPGIDAYYCTSSSTSSCKKVTSLYIYESDSITFGFKPSTTGKLYLRVTKANQWSNYQTMMVIK